MQLLRAIAGRPERLLALMAGCAVLVAACSDSSSGPSPEPTEFEWNLPPGFPTPVVPDNNPMSLGGIDLGRHLFYDKRLSVTGQFSCASCHDQARAFTDGLPVGVGATGELHPRNSMSLANVAYGDVLNWANPNIRTLEPQALTPLFGQHPVELGLSGREDELFAMLTTDTTYQRLFDAAYPDGEDSVSLGGITKALAQFQRTLISGNSPYDRFARHNEPNAISASAKRGESLFFGERLECFHCHTGFNFTGAVTYVGKGFSEKQFFNTGLYNLGGTGAYPEPNVGLIEFSTLPGDMGRFKAPTLRNIALTAPYMHDGSVATLDEVLDHYMAGGRTIGSGPHAGIGSANPFKDGLVRGFELSVSERADVKAFLNSLTDTDFTTNPKFSNPWPDGSPAR